MAIYQLITNWDKNQLSSKYPIKGEIKVPWLGEDKKSAGTPPAKSYPGEPLRHMIEHEVTERGHSCHEILTAYNRKRSRIWFSLGSHSHQNHHKIS